MSEDHVATLKKARDQLIQERRDTANRMANPTTTSSAIAAPGFVSIQVAIEAIDRAIAHEEKIRPVTLDPAEETWNPNDPFGQGHHDA
jgi:hypothetical protein